ncbi:septum site-determining protein MinC [Methylorubrum suomiense]|uniref:Probable septum site-determining protein MinC n=1 Tax=Methylorubrum suomiense TaxID=144191 RepID=A0ABQ4UTG5_9HYPH|nr:septum site-determining protein MinC [Methylorubrum suomiense]GJE75471.1 Septum site-determining protein MinC [Methylorubrum suomiense]
MTARPPIRFRGRSFLAMVLAPVPPIDQWLAELDALKQRAPAFFSVRAIILDVTGLSFDRSDLLDLCAELNKRSITILGIEGIGPTSLGPGFPPPLVGGKPIDDFSAPEPGAEWPAGAAPASQGSSPSPAQGSTQGQAAPAPPRPRSFVLDQPVRSGQVIQHLDGDVTVMGSVASGAEVIAGGSIHIYGALRGRAIAGAVGDANARILCRKFEPELIAIDGLYKTADDLGGTGRSQAVQARLDGDTIVISSLD